MRARTTISGRPGTVATPYGRPASDLHDGQRWDVSDILGRLCLTNAPCFVRDAQAGPARYTDADVHPIDALSKRERCRATDRTDRDDVAGIRKIGFQEITTAVSISGEPPQSQSVGFVKGINYRKCERKPTAPEPQQH